VKEFYDLRIGKLSTNELINKFTSLLWYVPYIREQKALLKLFINNFARFMKERLEFDNPKTMDKDIQKSRIF